MSSKVTTFKFIFNNLLEYWHCLALWIGVGAFWAYTTTTLPYLIKLMVDATKLSDSQEMAFLMYGLVIKFLIIQFALVVLYRVQDALIIYFPPKLKKKISVALLDQMLLHGQTILHGNLSGSIANKISDVVSGIPEITKLSIERVLANFTMLSMVLYKLYITSIYFFIAMSIWITVFLSVSILVVFKKRSLAIQAAQARTVVTGNIVDVLSNLETVKSFSASEYELDYHNKIVDVHIAKDRKRDMLFLVLHSFQGFTFFIFQSACFYYLLKGIKCGFLSTGDFILVASLNTQIVTSFWGIARDIREIWDKLGTVGHALEVIYSPLEVSDDHQAKKLIVSAGEIIFDKVKFCYKNSAPIFENKTIKILPGQKVGIVGYSGSGKTTFANLILRTFEISGGSILIDGQDIKSVTQKSIRQNICVIAQNPILFNRTVFQNIAYSCPGASKEDVIQAAIKANAHEFILSLPDQYDFKVGEQGLKLSGGQRQRIAIARAFLKNAPILIFDEATSQLDALSEEAVAKSLMSLAEGRTTIIISHRLATLVNSDRILVFDQGKIIQDGPHKDLVIIPGLYRSLWQAQLSVSD